jgi:putative ABC transport system permease protein
MGARVSALVEQLVREFALSWRRTRTAPGIAVFAILTLAIGIGVTMATYSVVYTALWRPLGVADVDRVLLLGRSNAIRPHSERVSVADYEAIAREQRTFAGIGAWASFPSVLSTSTSAELITAEAVTGSYFDVLQVPSALGRMLTPDDDRPGARAVVVVAHATWRDQFNRDPAIVGRAIQIGDRSFQVVGIAPAGFRGVHADGFAIRAAWIPMAQMPRTVDPRLTIAFRLSSGQTPTEASAEVAAIGHRLDAGSFVRNWTTVPVTEDLTVNDQDAMGRLVIGLPGLVLLIACTNLANLVLSRGASRRQEFGVRRALGAPRWRLIREQLVEQIGIAVIGGVGGLVVASQLVRVAETLSRRRLAPFMRNVQLDWALDPTVVIACGLAVVIAVIVSGLIPALHLTRDSLRTVLETGGGNSTPKWRGRGNLIALQVGVSVGLFLVAIVFVRMMLSDPQFRNLQASVAPGLENIVVASIPFTIQGRTDAETSELTTRILDRLREVPGVTDVAAASLLPFDRSAPTWDLTASVTTTEAEDGKREGVREFVAATPAFFEIAATPIRFGRAFTADDTASSEPVAIVSDAMARDVFGVENVVGRQITLRISRMGKRQTPEQGTLVTIVGVSAANEIVARSGKRVPTPAVHVPLAQVAAPSLNVVARGRPGEVPSVDTVRDAINDVDPRLAVAYVSPADVLATGPLAFLRQIVSALLGLALLALGLSMTGLYGVLSHIMAWRTREMGIRVALGARRTNIVSLVLKDGFRPIAEGLFIGLATASVFRFYLRTAMAAVDVAPLDVGACVAAAVLVGVAGAAACYLPARRAASVDPNVALRRS